MPHPSPLPAEGTQQHRLLLGLLDGDKISPISAIVDYNCFAPMARCAELRKLGWPIETGKLPHPQQDKFPGATLPYYFLDQHFRRWMREGEGERHPLDYPSQSGRGKFAQEKAA